MGVLAGAFGGATIAEKIAHYLARYPSIAAYGESIGIFVVVLVVTYLSLVLGELVPERLALHRPERIAAAVAGPMSLLSRIGAPLVAILSFFINALLKIFPLRDSAEPAVTVDDVRGLIRMGTQTGVFEPPEQQIVERVFQFADRQVRSIMTVSIVRCTRPPSRGADSRTRLAFGGSFTRTREARPAIGVVPPEYRSDRLPQVFALSRFTAVLRRP